MDILLGRSMCHSWNDPSEVRSSRKVRLRLEVVLLAGLGLSKGARQGRGARGLTSLS